MEAIFRILISNVRTPKHSYGDMKAMIGSLYLAERRIDELVTRYGADTFVQCCEDIKNVSERLMRAEIAALARRRVHRRGPAGGRRRRARPALEDQGHAGHPRRRADRRLHGLRPAVLRAGQPDLRHHGVVAPTTPCCTWSRATSRTTTAATAPISVIAPPGSLRQRELPGVHGRRQLGHAPDDGRRPAEGVLALLAALVGGRRRHLRLHRLRRRGPEDARAVRAPAPGGRRLGRARRRRRQRRAVRQERQLRQHAGRGRRDALPVPEHGVPAGARQGRHRPPPRRLRHAARVPLPRPTACTSPRTPTATA